jgi:hypothetical protein
MPVKTDNVVHEDIRMVRKATAAAAAPRKRASKKVAKTTRPRGRPKLSADLKGTRRNVYLTPMIYEAAVKLGNGSLSAGIAIAVARVAAEEMAREAGKRRLARHK